ncbi:uncharacterized protein LOC110007961 [Amborella trichopoda]|uniref:uncharacterized protein LOC110007961 n=1 Tax=Amborella trichopoda TaxID=13333 RepID=UPI0009BE2243|nr:uncharacterized protein LOC110007961 [Amborella trichopoda]|eukprot:XP_020528184.1 uncharacterized protein LOC110007961 [Amborella trichopoda]
MVDADKKATMCILYEGIEMTKSAIWQKCSFAIKLIEIIERRWNTKFGHPIHYTGYYFNPNLFYLTLEHLHKIMEVIKYIIVRLERSHRNQVAVIHKLSMYRDAVESFRTRLAKNFRAKMDPAKW